LVLLDFLGLLAFLFLADLADFELPIPDSHEASGKILGLFPLKGQHWSIPKIREQETAPKKASPI
jgi:hypothetical protein